jgi:hypothetical protein
MRLRKEVKTHASKPSILSAAASQPLEAAARTEIADLTALGPELDERQLWMVSGGQMPDGDTVTTSCASGCHDS